MALKVNVPRTSSARTWRQEPGEHELTIICPGQGHATWFARPFDVVLYERAIWEGEAAQAKALEDGVKEVGELYAIRRAAFLGELAALAVTRFGEDFTDADGRPHVCDDAHVRALMTIPEIARGFEHAYCGRMEDRAREKKSSPPALDSILPASAAPGSAPDASS